MWSVASWLDMKRKVRATQSTAFSNGKPAATSGISDR